jgi:chromosome segregation ATPase
MDSIRTELKTKLNEMETQLEGNEKLKRNADECKFVATEEYNNTARMVEDLETEIANMKEKMKHVKQQLKDNLKVVEDGSARHTEISLSLLEKERKLKESEEACQSIKAHMLDVEGQMKLLFAEMDAMYADLLQKMKDSTNSLDLGP